MGRLMVAGVVVTLGLATPGAAVTLLSAPPAAPFEITAVAAAVPVAEPADIVWAEAPLRPTPEDTLAEPQLLSGPAMLGGIVPEPATWALLVMGFGLMGALRRRDRVVSA